MQRLRGVITGSLVGFVLAAYVGYWLHGVREAAILAGAGIGFAIALVVGTRRDPADAAADEAWREVAPDLPPFSDRTALEASQANMPGPAQVRPDVGAPVDGSAGASPAARE
ncbi:MAG: hypothetical protein ACXWM8_01895 [Candidatus Limnocylindrales bacterium]